jgi:hypothetical protein
LAVFRKVAVSTVTVHGPSDHAELAATAVRHADLSTSPSAPSIDTAVTIIESAARSVFIVG